MTELGGGYVTLLVGNFQPLHLALDDREPGPGPLAVGGIPLTGLAVVDHAQ